MNQKLIGRVRASNELMRDALERALAEVGLHDEFEIASVTLRLKVSQKKCPPGEVAVWETTARPDGTVVSEWVCRRDI